MKKRNWLNTISFHFQNIKNKIKTNIASLKESKTTSPLTAAECVHHSERCWLPFPCVGPRFQTVHIVCVCMCVYQKRRGESNCCFKKNTKNPTLKMGKKKGGGGLCLGDLFCRENLMAEEQLAGRPFRVGGFGSRHVAVRPGHDLRGGGCPIPARFYQPCGRGLSDVTWISGVILGTWDPAEAAAAGAENRQPFRRGLCVCCCSDCATTLRAWGTQRPATGGNKSVLQESRGGTSAAVLLPALPAPGRCLQAECAWVQMKQSLRRSQSVCFLCSQRDLTPTPRSPPNWAAAEYVKSLVCLSSTTKDDLLALTVKKHLP